MLGPSTRNGWMEKWTARKISSVRAIVSRISRMAAPCFCGRACCSGGTRGVTDTYVTSCCWGCCLQGGHPCRGYPPEQSVDRHDYTTAEPKLRFRPHQMVELMLHYSARKERSYAYIQ